MAQLDPECSPRLAVLRDCVRQLTAQAVETLGSAELGEDLVGLRDVIDRLEAEHCRRLALFEARKGYAEQGSPSLVSWLREHCRLSGAGAYQRAEVARNLDAIPDAERALQRGEIGFGHAVALARTVSEMGKETARQSGPGLLDAAKRLDPDDLRLLGRNLRHCVDPDGALAASLASHDQRRLSVSQTLDGVYVIDGLVDVEGGATLTTAIESLSTRFPGDVRTPAQRRADALVELASRHLQSGEASSEGGFRPHLMVKVAADVLEGTAGGSAELEGAGPIPIAAARRLACDASMSALRISGSGQPLDVGRSRRTIPPALRRALAERDRGCRFPGCDRPLAWTHAHHIRHWIDRGRTSLDNLILLCRFHHHLVHEGGWSLRQQSDGSWLAEPP